MNGNFYKAAVILILILLVSTALSFAQTTGKIAGRVTDSETDEPLPGVNVVLEGTSLGAATDEDGYFTILNVDPGTYDVTASMIGYQQVTKSGAEVSIGHTTPVQFSLEPAAIAGEAVTVEAQREVVKLDLSSSSITVAPQEIEETPMVSNLSEMVNLQAGVEGMSVRGGSADETQFMVDGLMVVDNRASEPVSSLVNLSAVKSLEVLKGGFNAEYGNVRSGVITVVTKEGSPNRYSGSVDLRYTPARIKHSGPSVFNWQNYYLRPYLDPAVRMDGTDQWPEKMQNQYPTFEGWKAFSDRRLGDDNPDNDLTPEQAMHMFMWQHRAEGSDSLGQTLANYGKKPDWNLDAGLGGPVPLIGPMLGNLTFFVSHRNYNSMFALPVSRDYYRERTTQLKLTSRLTNNMKVTLDGISGVINSVFQQGRGGENLMNGYLKNGNDYYNPDKGSHNLYWPDTYNPFDAYRDVEGLSVEHTLSPKTFYELRLSRLYTKNWSDGPRKFRDTTAIRHFGAVPMDEQPYGWAPAYGTPGKTRKTIADGFGIATEGSEARDKSNSTTWTAKFDLTSQISRQHMLKTGVIVNYDNLDIWRAAYKISEPGEGRYQYWKAYPLRAGAYIQDKFEFQGMIANFGVRADYNDPNTRWYTADPYSKYFTQRYQKEFTDLAPSEHAKGHLRISPRLGISHPISENSKFYFNYGHFYSLIPTQDMYEINYGSSANGIAFIGNPSADPARTVAYEVGVEGSLFNTFLLHAAGYYKDVTGESGNVAYTGYTGGVNYTTITNNNYHDVRGFEFRIEKRTGWIGGWLNYDYRVSKSGYIGRQHYYEDIRKQRVEGLQNPYQETPLARPVARGNFRMTTPRNWGPKFGGINPLGGWTVSLLYTYRAGNYFTWDPLQTYELQNNLQWSAYQRIDAKITYNLHISQATLRLYADVNNLFNITNLTEMAFSDGNDRRAYLQSLRLPMYAGKKYQDQGYTSGSDKPGDLQSKDKPYINDPNRKFLYYLDQRYVTFGVRINF